MNITCYRNKKELEEIVSQEDIVDFLFEHLGQFGDPKAEISKAIDYAFSNTDGKGGFIELAIEEDNLVGVLVMNKTGMTGYIPRNILVYVAVKADQRGKGVGNRLITKAINEADNDVALHVEYDNPAKRLYERIGFKSKYAEMRFKKE